MSTSTTMIPTVRIVRVTPEVAYEWLAANTRNRTISSARVQQMVTDIRAGRWDFNGETIKFATSGALLDGQHRLMAVFESGIPVDLLVVEGLPESVQDTIDIGRTRTTGDMLSLRGIANGNNLAALSRNILRYDQNPGQVWGPRTDPSKAEIGAFCLNNHVALLEAWQVAANASRDLRVHAQSYALLKFLVDRDSASPERWEDFHAGIRYGIGLTEGDPRLTFRSWHHRRGALSNIWRVQQMVAIAIKSWNSYVSGRPLRVLKFGQAELPMPKVS